jgi:hypothetical protein
MERFEIGERLGFWGGRFRSLIWGNIILSLLDKVCINSGVIGRHGGSVISD